MLPHEYPAVKLYAEWLELHSPTDSGRTYPMTTPEDREATRAELQRLIDARQASLAHPLNRIVDVAISIAPDSALHIIELHSHTPEEGPLSLIVITEDDALDLNPRIETIVLVDLDGTVCIFENGAIAE